jgi:hypothetical protein
MDHYCRSFETHLLSRLSSSPDFINIVLGPRQVGKTSGVLNVLKTNYEPKDFAYHSSEEFMLQSDWLQASIQEALSANKKVLVFDEIQKIPNWAEFIKLGWDRSKRNGHQTHWVLLGSSSLDLALGLGESLAGRFEILPVHHWSFLESKEAFGLTWEQYLTYGGYPGSYKLIDQPDRFKRYMIQSIFESVVTKDILRHASVKKPALFRQTFQLASQYPAQEISYNKLLGQLTEAGNVEQIKHYLELFQKAFLMTLVFKKTKSPLSRSSSPKIIPLAPVFSSLFNSEPLRSEELGRVFEAVVGSRLCENFSDVYFWRSGHKEIDLVVEIKGTIYGIEVKSNRKRVSHLEAFKREFKKSKTCIINFNNYLDFEQNPKEFLVSNSL